MQRGRAQRKAHAARQAQVDLEIPHSTRHMYYWVMSHTACHGLHSYMFRVTWLTMSTYISGSRDITCNTSISRLKSWGTHCSTSSTQCMRKSWVRLTHAHTHTHTHTQTHSYVWRASRHHRWYLDVTRDISSDSYILLQHTATHCNTLQHTATHITRDISSDAYIRCA